MDLGRLADHAGGMSLEPSGRVLVIDPRSLLPRDVEASLADRGYLVESAADEVAALALVEQSVPDVVLVALDLPEGDGFDFLERARTLLPTASFVAVAESGSTDTLVQALQRGADRCLTLPIRPDALRLIIDRSMEKPFHAKEAIEARADAAGALASVGMDPIVGAHPAMQRTFKRLLQAARSRATVLIQGETGTGKELIAKAIHDHSLRSHGPLVRLNCAALAESVLESELFGHEKGAFTGALARRKGRFEQADGGTLFLDELSEMPPAVQVKLLRFLQEREFERVGGNQTLKVDVRVVAATNRDLASLVSDGTFREDLFYRLKVVVLDVPPLRARPSDISLLAEHFLRHYAKENGKVVTGLAADALEALLDYPWPGNVRELQHAIEQAVILSETQEIGLDDLPIAPPTPEFEPIKLLVPGVTLAEVERYAILKTLEAVNGSTSKAAAILGISRRTIQYRLHEWGLATKPDRETRQSDSNLPEQAR